MMARRLSVADQARRERVIEAHAVWFAWRLRALPHRRRLARRRLARRCGWGWHTDVRRNR